MIYIQDVGIPANGLRRRLWCVLKKLLKSPQKDLLADLVARRGSPVVFTGVPGAAKGWRRRLWCSWKKLLMEFILALGFGLWALGFGLWALGFVFLVTLPPKSRYL